VLATETDAPYRFAMDAGSLAEAIWLHAPDAMLVVDSRGTITRVNPAGVALFGYPEDELVGRSIEVLVPARFREGHVEKRGGWAGQSGRRMMGAPLSALTALHRGGEELAVEVALSPLMVDGERCTIAIIRDVRPRQKLEEELRYRSTHDSLTGLYNRAYLDQELARLARGRRFPVALIVIDIDGLKPVNDTGGHAAGDALLIRAGRLFASVARGDDVVARAGGDEFVLVLPQTPLEAAVQVVARLAIVVETHNRGEEVPVRYSAGVAVAHDGARIPSALREADDRMYAHKRSRRAGRV
jgi:diguanylate cyclase (GGDEF)-like protein/PAS domain S-box-containing protein